MWYGLTTWYFVVVIMISVPVAWELVTLVHADLRTISEVWAAIGRQWNPFVEYALSALVGHWFLRPERNLAQHVTEAGEVFVVVWVGWGVFWFFYVNPEMLPLPSWANLLIILSGIFIGGWCWTIGS